MDYTKFDFNDIAFSIYSAWKMKTKTRILRKVIRN